MKSKVGKNRKPAAIAVSPTVTAGDGMDLVACLKSGLAHYQIGRLAEADQIFRKALQLDPDNAIAFQLLGAISQQRNEHQEAAIFFERALESRPGNAEINNNLGTSLNALGQFDDAIRRFERALELEPEYAMALSNLGGVLTQVGRSEEAVSRITLALQLRPDSPDAHNNMGNALKELGKFDAAVKEYSRALELKPGHPEYHYNLGVILEVQELYDDAKKAYHAALKSKPDYADAHFNIGNIYKLNGDLEQARSHYEKARKINPEYTAVYNNLGIVLSDLGLLEDAEQCFRNAIELNSNFADAHMNLGINLFMRGDIRNGWDEYEWRMKSENNKSPRRSFLQPQWDGSALHGKSILLWGEQGLGDEIRYASLIPDMLDKGGQVSIECTPRLVDLFQRSFPEATVYAYPFVDTDKGKASFDFQCPFPGLGRYLRPTIETFSRQPHSYLVPDPGRLAFWRDRLAGVSPRPKIGISWRSMDVSAQWQHFYATIGEMAPLMSVPDVDFVNLMCQADERELDQFEELYGVKLLCWDDLDLRDDLDDVAALNANLDMVVSCMSSVTEMSGALGIKTLGFIGEEKNFIMMGTGDAIWSPETRYFSKNRSESWQPVFKDMAEEINRYLEFKA